MVEPSPRSNADDRDDRSDAPLDRARFWQIQLELSKRDHKPFHEEGDKCFDRYRNEKRRSLMRNSGKRFNIFYSNTEVLRAALYGKSAKPSVGRRFKDADPVGRAAGEIMQRALISSQEVYDCDKEIDRGIQDYLIAGRGVIRLEYEPEIAQRPVVDPMTGMPAQVADEDGAMQDMIEDYIADQALWEKYVYWKDYLQAPARNWGGVWWIAFRHTFTREELEKNGFENITEIPLNWAPDLGERRGPVPDELKKAEVWEVWDKTKKQRNWIVFGYDKTLRTDDDPYQLKDFYPLAEPICSYATTETAIPEPEFHAYQDQADDLDEITNRISVLTKAMKRRGVYDQSVKELKRLATASDNQYIPVENYAKLSEKGGLVAAFQTEDISMIAKVLLELYKQRDMLVQSIYEITGIADIVRGSSDPNETASAQNLKAQFGSQRLKRRQRAVQKWIRDAIKIKAEIIGNHYEPDVLQRMTGMQVQPPVMQILRSDEMLNFRIDIETDSTIFEDASAEKQSRTEAVAALGQYLEKAAPMVQQHPEYAPFVVEMAKFLIRGFTGTNELEDALDQLEQSIQQKVQMMAQQPPQPSPEQLKAQADAAKVQAQAQLNQQDHQNKSQQMMTQAQIDQQQAKNELVIQNAQAQGDLERVRAETVRDALAHSHKMEHAKEAHKHKPAVQH